MLRLQQAQCIRAVLMHEAAAPISDWCLQIRSGGSEEYHADMPVNPEQARSYLDRWKLVQEVEAQELRHTSMEIKARQLAALMSSRSLFREDRERQGEVDMVRARWLQIRGALCV